MCGVSFLIWRPQVQILPGSPKQTLLAVGINV